MIWIYICGYDMDMDIMWICIWMWMNNGYVSGHDMDMNMIMSEHVHRNCYAHDVAMDMIRTWICHGYVVWIQSYLFVTFQCLCCSVLLCWGSFLYGFSHFVCIVNVMFI